MIDLSEKVCVVTGSYKGIGKEIVKTLKHAGATVVGVDNLGKSSDLDFLVDVSSYEDVRSFVNEFKATHKKVDVIVNCAGITLPTTTGIYDKDDWSKTLSVNLNGPFFLTTSLLDCLKSVRSASVINITSLNASLGFPDNPAYVASKTGLLGLTRSWAVDWGKFNIRVNAVSPGYIKTDMTGESWVDVEKRKDRANRTCLERWGSPTDVANAVAFLASDISEYITGQMLNVDGGWTVRGL